MASFEFEFEAGNNKKYEIDGIWNNIIYARELATKQLSRLYYLVFSKNYLEKKNI